MKLFNRIKNLVVVICFGVLFHVALIGIMHGNESEEDRLPSGGQREEAENRTLTLKGAAFFQALKVLDGGKTNHAAVDGYNQIFKIEGDSIYIEWKGNFSKKITNVYKAIFSREFSSYTYMGLGYADRSGMGIKFLMKIGEFSQEISLEYGETILRKVIEIGDKNYVVCILLQEVEDDWIIVSKRKKTHRVTGKGYLIKIEYIEEIEGDLEDFMRKEESLVIEKMQYHQNFVKEKLDSVERLFKDLQNAHNFKESQSAEKQIQEAYLKIIKAINHVKLCAFRFKSSQEVLDIISECQEYQKQALAYSKKAKHEIKNKEKKILEEIKRQEVFIQTKMADVERALKFLEEAVKNDDRNFDEMFKIFLIIKEGDDEGYKIYLDVKAKANEIAHNNEAQKAFEEIIKYAIRIEECFEKARELAQKIRARINELLILEEARIRKEKDGNERRSKSRAKSKIKEEGKKEKGKKRKTKKVKRGSKSKKTKKSHKTKKHKKHLKSKKVKNSKKSKNKKANKKSSKNRRSR